MYTGLKQETGDGYSLIEICLNRIHICLLVTGNSYSILYSYRFFFLDTPISISEFRTPLASWKENGRFSLKFKIPERTITPSAPLIRLNSFQFVFSRTLPTFRNRKYVLHCLVVFKNIYFPVTPANIYAYKIARDRVFITRIYILWVWKF